MPTIDEAMNMPIEPTESPVAEMPVVEESRGIDLSFLKVETGPGEIEDYLTHPINPGKNRGLAQLLRGLTGMCGSLRFALIDIVVGGLEYMRTRKGSADVINPSRGIGI